MLNKIKFYYKIILFCLSTFIITKYINSIKLYDNFSIIINGNHLIADGDIKNKIQSLIKEENILELNINKIQNEINNNPYIESSNAFIKIPSSLYVNIKEITPIALFELNEDIYFIDKRLIKIKANKTTLNYFSVPVISNFSLENINYEHYGNLLNRIKINNLDFFNEINEIIVTDNSTILKIGNDTKVILDKNKEINNTIKLLSFIETIKGNKKIIDYKYVDLSIPKQIIVKENKKI